MKKILKKLLKFRKDRDWDQFHTARNLAISLSLEAAEVLEKFQWKRDDGLTSQEINELKDEVADVFNYTLLLAHALKIDLLDAAEKKIVKNARKYPISKSKGRSVKYTQL